MAWDVVGRPQLLDAVIAARPCLASLSFGAVGSHVARLHDAGILVTTQVHDLAETVAANEAGVDLIVVQGNEAGGHTGAVATVPNH
jgi:nitronate monooxygenase